MAHTNLVQIAAYIPPDLKGKLDKDHARFPVRLSFSRYIEHILRKHIERQK